MELTNLTGKDLGEVKSGDTIHFNIPVFNKSKSQEIKIKKISSECSCTIIQDKDLYIQPNDSVMLNGLFLASKTEFGPKKAKLVINSTSDSTFNIIDIHATVIK